MSWTDERVATLKKLWDAGESAASIAKQLGGVSRCAVLGVVNRKGWSRHAPAVPKKAERSAAARPQRPAPAPRPLAVVRPVASAVAERKPNPEPPLPRPPEALKTLLERGPGQCCYPVGTPDPARGQLYCAAATPDDYCGQHRRVMYRLEAKPVVGIRPDMSRQVGKRFATGSGRRFAE